MKKAYVNQKLCVACGCCLTACRLEAITIPKGIHARINPLKCVGCGLCAKICPASIITIKEAPYNE